MNARKKTLPHIVVLDPDQKIQSSLKELLQDLFEVHSAKDAHQAVAALKAHPVAVVVTDQRWVKTELDLLAKISSISDETRVLLTGFDNQGEISRAVDRGHIYAYVAKPWEPLELRLTIAQAVEHYKMVRELNRERLLFQQLMSHSPDVIYFKDADSRFTRVNQAKADLIGAAHPIDLIGKGDWDFFSDEEAAQIRAEDEEVLSTQEAVVDRLHSFTPPDGRLRWFSTSKVPLDEKAGGGLVGMSRDITERKLAEEKLREVTGRLVQAEKEKREFCAQVVLAVTDGKLHLVEYPEIPELPELTFSASLSEPANYGRAREAVRELATGLGLDTEQTEDVILATGEAITNAVKHAQCGICEIAQGEGEIVVRVSDQGDGIHPEALPETLFRTGFSTQVSLGLGYTLLLQLVDEMWLATGPEGTILQLVKRTSSPDTDEATLLALLERF